MGGPGFDRFAGWWRSAQLAAVGAALVVVELVLVGQLGTPAGQLRTLHHIGDALAGPVACMLAVLTLIVEALVAYLLGVLVLRSLSLLPGSLGRLAARIALLVTPVAVRRILDLVVGGALLAQTTLALLPATAPGHRSVPVRAAIATSLPFTGCSPPTDCSPLTGSASFAGSLAPATRPGEVPAGLRVSRLAPVVAEMQPVDTRPTSRRLSAPLPPWLGGGPSIAPSEQVPHGPGSTRRPPVAPAQRPGQAPAPAPGPGPGPGDGAGPSARSYTVEPHDTLWGIAAAHLGPAARSSANIHRYWQQVYRANRAVIGTDPDLIHPGTRLEMPRYRRGRR